MIPHHKHLLTGAVTASVAILLAGCSGSSNTSSEPLRNDSTAITGMTVNLADTPGEWVEAMKITEDNKKKVNDFQVTTVSGECYFNSETILASEQNSTEDSEEPTKPTNGTGEASESKLKLNEQKLTTEPHGEAQTKEAKMGYESLTYKVKSNEGELLFKGLLKDDSAPLVANLNDGTTVQLTYGCNPGMVKDKKAFEGDLKEMVALVDIEIERNDQ